MKARIPAREVTYTLTTSPEDIPVRGNALASGDDEEDRKYEDETIRRLDDGDEWAWCSVTVTASWNGFTGVAHLGCCSYASEADFTAPGGYYDDLKAEALDDLVENVKSAYVRSKPAIRR